LVSMLPFWSGLCRGHRFRWFAVNVPMRLAGDASFTSDIDIIAKLQEYPPSKKWFYRTWEVKVGLLFADGRAKSLKAGKLDRTFTQLSKYREFGTPETSLLDMYLCQAGLLDTGRPFSMPMLQSMSEKQSRLAAQQFGFEVVVVEHVSDAGPGLALKGPQCKCGGLVHNVLRSRRSDAGERFIRLVQAIESVFEGSPPSERPLPHMVYCEKCKTLQRIRLNTHQACPACRAKFELWGSS
jgi:hypothetical protein